LAIEVDEGVIDARFLTFESVDQEESQVDDHQERDYLAPRLRSLHITGRGDHPTSPQDKHCLQENLRKAGLTPGTEVEAVPEGDDIRLGMGDGIACELDRMAAVHLFVSKL